MWDAVVEISSSKDGKDAVILISFKAALNPLIHLGRKYRESWTLHKETFHFGHNISTAPMPEKQNI